MKMADLFKPAILVLAVIFLLIFYQYSQNGRYTYHEIHDDISESQYVVDSRTGIAYSHVSSTDMRFNSYYSSRDILNKKYTHEPAK
jgi:hypothetical protein